MLGNMMRATRRNNSNVNDENVNPAAGKAGKAQASRRPLQALHNIGNGQQQPGASQRGKISKPSRGTSKQALLPGAGAMAQEASMDVAPLAAEPMIDDIDEFDHENPQAATEYVDEIFEYLRNKEHAERVDPTYMERQPILTSDFRAILIDWLVDVHLRFQLLSETMYLTVNLIDRFLMKRPVPRVKFQLVGIAALLIASKVEETYAPYIRDLVYISENSFKASEIRQMERVMLNALGFNVTAPTPLHFLRRFSKAARSDSKTHTLSKYLMEMSLLEYGMLNHLPSMIAASSVYVARIMLNKGPTVWTPTLEHYTTYSEQALVACAEDMFKMLASREKSSLQAINNKYSARKFLSVARIPVPKQFQM